MLADGRLRRLVGWTGIALLGAALAYAPIAAFGEGMLTVSRVGLAGLLLILVASRLPRPPSAAQDDATAADLPPGSPSPPPARAGDAAPRNDEA